jgi:hypothetical protein
MPDKASGDVPYPQLQGPVAAVVQSELKLIAVIINTIMSCNLGRTNPTFRIGLIEIKDDSNPNI